jgi:outer membrane protein assembly factor BamE
MKKYLPLFLSIIIVNLSGCTTIATHFPGVYAIDVEQGNIIDQDMIDQLRPKMNKRQVLYVMGTPMLIDVFHQHRWEYIYSIQPGGEDRLQKRIALFFDNDILANVQGDFRPSRLPVMRPSNEETVDVPKRILQKTMYEKITGLFTSDDVNNATIAAKQANNDLEDGAASINKTIEDNPTLQKTSPTSPENEPSNINTQDPANDQK